MTKLFVDVKTMFPILHFGTTRMKDFKTDAVLEADCCLLIKKLVSFMSY